MRRDRWGGYRHLAVVTGVLIALFAQAVIITLHATEHRQNLTAQRDAAQRTAEQSDLLRREITDLFTWQMASALAVVDRNPAAFGHDDPNQLRRQAGFDQLTGRLDAIAARPLQETQRQQVAEAQAALAALHALGDTIRADYTNGDAARRRAAITAVTTIEIDQYQLAAEAVAALAEGLEVTAKDLTERTSTVSHDTGVLLLVLTTAMIGIAAALVLWVWRADRRRHVVISQLTVEANLDPLTGVANRRLWDQAMTEELRRGKAAGTRCTVVLIDLDHFKRFNDTYGHPAGDVHLQAVARVFEEAVRRNDTVARLGGEEFGLLLSGSVAEDAAAVLDRIRPQIPDHQTFSAGVAEWNGNESAAELIARADRALYQAKSAGRDRSALAAA